VCPCVCVCGCVWIGGCQCVCCILGMCLCGLDVRVGFFLVLFVWGPGCGVRCGGSVLCLLHMVVVFLLSD